MKQCTRRRHVVEIAGGCRRTAELDATFTAITQLIAGGVDNPDLVAR
jgi:hypothetical protein